MLNRRNVRVKVMQALYADSIATENPTEMNISNIQYTLSLRFQEFKRLVAYSFYTLMETIGYAKVDKEKKMAKHIPDPEEINSISLKLITSNCYTQMSDFLIWRFSYKIVLQEPYKDFLHIKIKVLYKQMVNSPAYIDYINNKENIEEKQIIQAIWEDVIQPSPEWEEILAECLPYADTDEENLNVILVNLLQLMEKKINLDENQYFLIYKDRMEFANKLIETVVEKNEYITHVIKSKLQHWNEDRVSKIDFILLKMSIAELLYFDEIPSKVTLNEYIDIAKDYSTSQSGHFINGILDSIYKDTLINTKQKP